MVPPDCYIDPRHVEVANLYRRSGYHQVLLVASPVLLFLSAKFISYGAPVIGVPYFTKETIYQPKSYLLVIQASRKEERDGLSKLYDVPSVVLS